MHKFVETDTETLFTLLAERLHDKLVNLLRTQHRVNMALPGGRSVVGLLKVLNPRLQQLLPDDKGRLHIYLTDERVTSSAQQLNETLLVNNLPDHLNTHFDLIHSAAGYNQYFNQADHYFDIIVFGVGEDGHIASIFPAQSSAHISQDYYTPIDYAPKLPAQRISLSEVAVRESKNIILLFIGSEKQAALQHFLDEKLDVRRCPAKIVRRSRANVLLATDNHH